MKVVILPNRSKQHIIMAACIAFGEKSNCMSLTYIIILLVTLSACNACRYNGSDTRQPLDSVLVTDNPDGKYTHTFTDGNAPEEERRKHITTIKQHPMISGDTVFIANEEETTVYVNDTTIPHIIIRNKVYIDPDKHSKHYSRVINFNLDNGERYHRSPATPKRNIPLSLPLLWVPLDEYKGAYYLYSSLEHGIMRYKITDTTLVSLGWVDGDYGFAYDSIVQDGNDRYVIKGRYKEGLPVCDEIRIYMIDADKGIAVFEGYEDGEKDWQALYVDAAKARNFPVIVHEYYGNFILKPVYYPLDTTNFDKLLKKFKTKK